MHIREAFEWARLIIRLSDWVICGQLSKTESNFRASILSSTSLSGVIPLLLPPGLSQQPCQEDVPEGMAASLSLGGCPWTLSSSRLVLMGKWRGARHGMLGWSMG